MFFLHFNGIGLALRHGLYLCLHPVEIAMQRRESQTTTLRRLKSRTRHCLVHMRELGPKYRSSVISGFLIEFLVLCGAFCPLVHLAWWISDCTSLHTADVQLARHL